MANKKDELRLTIMTRIEDIAKSEVTVKEQVGLVATEILEHYNEHADGTLAVKLMGVLTPMNKRAAEAFFDRFLFVSETGAKKGTNKVRAKVDQRRKAFIESGMTFWEWTSEEVKVEPKPLDFKAELSKALKRAINGVHSTTRDQEGLSKSQIASIIIGEISIPEMLAAVTANPDVSEVQLPEKAPVAEPVAEALQAA